MGDGTAGDTDGVTSGIADDFDGISITFDNGDSGVTMGILLDDDLRGAGDPTDYIPTTTTWTHDHDDITVLPGFTEEALAASRTAAHVFTDRDSVATLSDTGAQFHNFNDRRHFTTFTPTSNRSAYDAGKHSHRVLGRRVVNLVVTDDANNPMTITLEAECVPTLPNLVNSTQLYRSGRYTLAADARGRPYQWANLHVCTRS